MNKVLNIDERLSLLGIVIMINMIFDDIYSIIVEMTQGGVLELPAAASYPTTSS